MLLSQLHEKLMKHSAAANENEVGHPSIYMHFSIHRTPRIKIRCAQMVDAPSKESDDDIQSEGEEEEDEDDQSQGVSCPVCDGRG